MNDFNIDEPRGRERDSAKIGDKEIRSTEARTSYVILHRNNNSITLPINPLHVENGRCLYHVFTISRSKAKFGLSSISQSAVSSDYFKNGSWCRGEETRGCRGRADGRHSHSIDNFLWIYS